MLNISININISNISIYNNTLVSTYVVYKISEYYFSILRLLQCVQWSRYVHCYIIDHSMPDVNKIFCSEALCVYYLRKLF